jgi:tetratricopeptide (TPR) repeat protein
MTHKNNPSANGGNSAEPGLTAGVVAMINLQAQIDGRERHFVDGEPATVRDQVELIELVALRGQILGRIDDYEWVEARAERLARDAPRDAMTLVTRARTRGRFHRFSESLDDLDAAERLGADSALVATERAGVLQAIGRYEEALAIYEEAARCRDASVLGARATLHAERRETEAAEQLFDESLTRYRGVSPFPPALLDFQRGLMWLAQDDLHRALGWFQASVCRLPDYAAAQGHLAEVEAALGGPEQAIARLLPLTASSDDPDYAASLARILAEAERPEEAATWRNKAAARYDELMARHPEAFADHAAEFWLDAGDAPRARRFAQMNLEIRQTPRARELARAAALGCHTHGH